MTYLSLLFQVPKILIRIKKEHKWLKNWAQQAPVRAVISDNRYGLHLAGVHSIFITHQLLVKTGAGRFWDQLLQKLHYRLIKRFSACWVPDQEGPVSAAGELSHPSIKPEIPLRYIGCISRLQPCALMSPFEYDVLMILSGPEPQRTVFEQLLIAALKDFDGRAALVRGITANGNRLQVPAHVALYDRLSSVELNELICRSRIVISRSGYSSVMDLLKLNKKMIVVPTPGQTEQEYLAKWLHQNKLAYAITQKNFSLRQLMQQAENFDWSQMQWNMEQYHEVLQAFTNEVLAADDK